MAVTGLRVEKDEGRGRIEQAMEGACIKTHTKGKVSALEVVTILWHFPCQPDLAAHSCEMALDECDFFQVTSAVCTLRFSTVALQNAFLHTSGFSCLFYECVWAPHCSSSIYSIYMHTSIPPIHWIYIITNWFWRFTKSTLQPIFQWVRCLIIFCLTSCYIVR